MVHVDGLRRYDETKPCNYFQLSPESIEIIFKKEEAKLVPVAVVPKQITPAVTAIPKRNFTP